MATDSPIPLKASTIVSVPQQHYCMCIDLYRNAKEEI